MNTESIRLLLMLALASFTATPGVLAQGLLIPPGPPAPTMKTLQQIEPRIDLQNAPPAAVTTNDAGYHYIITQPGSYYLSANLGVTKTLGIQINAEGVTLDLSGFEISRASSTGGTGIEILGTSHRASVRNGSIKGFSHGILCSFSTSYSKGCAFRDLAVSTCTNAGIFAGEGAVLESCRVHDSSGNYGIYAESGSMLSNCVASNNTAKYGIFAQNGSTLSNCSASNNASPFSFSAGIRAQSFCTLSHCNAYNNLTTHATPTATTGMGLYVSDGSTIQNCTVGSNRGDGISATSGCSILDCTVTSNNSAGIRASSGCTVTRCTLPNNVGYGLYSDADCAVSQCVAKGTTGTGVGLRVGDNSSVTGCTASANTTDGIQLTNRCHATNNSVSGNTGDGIDASGAFNRIDGNHVAGNTGVGIRSAGTDFTVRNSLNGNTGGNLVPGPGGNIAPLQQAFSATNPWANLQ